MDWGKEKSSFLLKRFIYNPLLSYRYPQLKETNLLMVQLILIDYLPFTNIKNSATDPGEMKPSNNSSIILMQIDCVVMRISRRRLSLAALDIVCSGFHFTQQIRCSNIIKTNNFHATIHIRTLRQLQIS